MEKDKIITAETLRNLLPGLHSPGGTLTEPKPIYITVVNVRAYISTNRNDLSNFNSFWNGYWTGVERTHMASYKDIPVQLYAEDFRKLQH
jgi:hypothetical protein